MERLTIKNNDGSYSQPTKTTFEKLFYKVAELEDFMEEVGFNTITELKEALTTSEVWEENQKLKSMWLKLKSWILDTKPAIRGASTMFMKSALLYKMLELEKENK